MHQVSRTLVRQSPTSVFEVTNAADDVHPFLGPVLIVMYALLSNTLLLTVLVAILGNTFATINADAAAEVSSLPNGRGSH